MTAKKKYYYVRNMVLSGLLLFSVPFSLISQEKTPWKASPELVQKLSNGRTDVNYVEEKVPSYTLPDALLNNEGKRVIHPEEWRKIRRPEILSLFESQVYGKVPSTPYQKKITVVKEDKKAMDGAATLKMVDITVTSGEKSLTIHMGLFIPNNVKKPVPAFLLICNRSSDNIDFTREKKSEFWPAEEVIARGYAIAAFNNADVDPDNFDNFKNGIHGVLDRERNNESWGTIAAWAWGASRCMDYLKTDKAIAKDKIALVGHSRGGKTALWAGALDERFAMVIPNEAGCGGTSLARRQYGEKVSRINQAFPHWFCENYKSYGNRVDSLPVDQHMLMALIAPRALYVTSADQDLWADPRGQYLALYNALPVYQLFKPDIRLSQEMPPMNTPVINGPVAYHVRNGEHNLLLKDWNWFMDFADKVFK
jgi:hypothetical protein